jgi:excisionase family DNA binding protein
MQEKELLTTGEVAEMLGVKKKLLEQWRWHKKGPGYCKIGKRIVRYRREVIDEFLKKGEIAQDE